MTQNLRRVTVKVKPSGNEIKGYFHEWFTKVYDTGESFLVAIIEQDNGVIKQCRMDSYEITFEKEHDPLDNYPAPISAGK